MGGGSKKDKVKRKKGGRMERWKNGGVEN